MAKRLLLFGKNSNQQKGSAICRPLLLIVLYFCFVASVSRRLQSLLGPSMQVVVGIRHICRSTAAVIANNVAKVIVCQVLYGIGHGVARINKGTKLSNSKFIGHSNLLTTLLFALLMADYSYVIHNAEIQKFSIFC